MKPIALSFAALLLAACGEVDAPATPDATPETDQAVTPAVFDRRKNPDLHIVDWVDAMARMARPISFADPLDQYGAEFVRLALAMGQLDGDYVDAYHGPESWRIVAESQMETPEELLDWVGALRGSLEQVQALTPESEVRLAQLKKLARGLHVRLQVIAGQTISFDREVTDIYDEEVPVYDLADYDAVLEQIDALLPGEGTTADRVEAFRNSLAIPEDKLQTVFDRAIEECRNRTMVHFDLPEGETFRMEFVTDKSWSGYNYYQGDYESLIQINTDFPIIIDRAVDLGCHEGYPGHHVWNLFIERELVGEREWIEYTVNPLFGPFGPLAEGSANYGIELAFPGDEKITFEREVLFPMAGLDPSKAETLQALTALTSQLSHATNEIARQYLNGELTREEAIPLIQKYYLTSAEKSAQRVSFIDKYRGYVINYNIGRDRAEAWVEAAEGDEDARWAAFREMLTRPMTPGDIADALK